MKGLVLGILLCGAYVCAMMGLIQSDFGENNNLLFGSAETQMIEKNNSKSATPQFAKEGTSGAAVIFSEDVQVKRGGEPAESGEIFSRFAKEASANETAIPCTLVAE